jgi:hypothetical protein
MFKNKGWSNHDRRTKDGALAVNGDNGERVTLMVSRSDGGGLPSRLHWARR